MTYSCYLNNNKSKYYNIIILHTLAGRLALLASRSTALRAKKSYYGKVNFEILCIKMGRYQLHYVLKDKKCTLRAQGAHIANY